MLQQIVLLKKYTAVNFRAVGKYTQRVPTWKLTWEPIPERNLMNVPGQDVPGNLQDLMSSQGSVPLLKVWNHLCLDNFRMMQWLVLWSFAKASICYAKVQLLNKSGLKMAIIKQFWLWNFSFDLASLFKSHFREHLCSEFFFLENYFQNQNLKCV